MKRWPLILLLLLCTGMVGGAQPVDITSQLMFFLTDLRAGTLGVNQVITTMKVGNGTVVAPSITGSSATTGMAFLASGLTPAITGGSVGISEWVAGGPTGLYNASGAAFGWLSGVLGSGTDTGFSRTAAATVAVGNGSQGDASGTLNLAAYQVRGVGEIFNVTSDFTTTSVTLANITGLSWTLPANLALTVPFSCKLYYSQATAAVADSFGIQSVTVAPTNLQVGGAVETALGTTAYGDATITTTTATTVVTATPSAITTIFNAYIDGFIENPSNASATAVNIMVLTGNVADAITVKRGSFCRLF